MAAHRAAHRHPVPTALVDLDRWVRWSPTKVPLRPDGRAASSSDPTTWSAHRAVTGSSAGVGVGFVLNGDGIVAVDFDDCLDGDDLAPWAAAVLARFPSTYVEVSPSGRGLHVWGRGVVSRGRRYRVAGGGIEVYGTGRYMTVTGDAFRCAPRVLGDLGNLDDLDL